MAEPISASAKTHCKEDPIYVFPENKLRGLSPNFHIHIHICVSDKYSHHWSTYFAAAE
jgi:hypothetical protein